MKNNCSYIFTLRKIQIHMSSVLQDFWNIDYELGNIFVYFKRSIPNWDGKYKDSINALSS